MSVIYPKRVKTLAKSGSTGLSNDVTLSEGTNVTLTQSGQDISIASTASGGAPTDATYVTLSVNGTLSQERVLTGTASQITVTDNGAGSTVVLSTPQDIATTSTPTFKQLTISGTTSGSSPITITGGTVTASSRLINATQTWNEGATVFEGIFVNITDTASAATSNFLRFYNGSNRFVIDKTGTITSGIWNAGTIPVLYGGTGQTSYTNGQLLIGNTTGNTLTKATLTGTANQVVVTNGTGSITLSTPQDIATTSDVTFGQIIASDGTLPQLKIASPNIAGARGMYILGTNAGETKFNFMIASEQNISNALEITPSTAAGGTTFSTPAIVIESGGDVGIGTTTPSRRLHVYDSTNAAVLQIETGGTNKSAQLELIPTGSGDAWIDYGLAAGGNDLYLYSYKTGIGTVATFQDGGNVGIGQTSPGSRFHVKQSANTVDGGITLEDSTGATATKFWRRGGAGTASTITDRGADTINFSAGLVGIGLIDPVDRLVVRGSSSNVGIEFGNTAGNIAYLQAYDRVGAAYTPLILAATAVQPNDNKGTDLGATGSRWNNIFYASATTGTSRLAPTNEVCDHCLTLNKTNKMVRGTGTTIYLGETADYMTVWCEECGHSKRMTLSHLPAEKLVERKPAPMIIFEGLEIKQYSGHSRGIQVKFRYGEDDPNDIKNKAPRNSTYLSDVEYENFKAMTEAEREVFIKQLGQREWDSMEEVRLMKECCEAEQIECDNLVIKFNGKDLLVA